MAAAANSHFVHFEEVLIDITDAFYIRVASAASFPPTLMRIAKKEKATVFPNPRW